DAAELADGVVDEVGDVVGARQVGRVILDAWHVEPCVRGALDVPARAIDIAQAVEHDRGAALRECGGDRQADAARRAGGERGLAGERVASGGEERGSSSHDSPRMNAANAG